MNLKKMTLNINGADRMFICDPEKDTLASVLRRLGLTGTKVGCGTGVCGACSVILRRQSSSFLYQEDQQDRRVQFSYNHRRDRQSAPSASASVCMGTSWRCTVRILRSGIHRLGLRAAAGKLESYERRRPRLVPEAQKRVQMYRIQADRRRCNGSCCYHAEARRHLRISHMTGRRISRKASMANRSFVLMLWQRHVVYATTVMISS